MLTCPQCPLLGIFHVVSFNVILNSGDGTVFNSILHKLFTADLRSFVHCRNHNITGFFFINLRHPCSHNMYSTEYHFTFLLTSIYTRKSFFNTFNFNATLIRKDITGGTSDKNISYELFSKLLQLYHYPHCSQKSVRLYSSIRKYHECTG